MYSCRNGLIEMLKLFYDARLYSFTAASVWMEVTKLNCEMAFNTLLLL